jgi:hypothetical protein
VALERVTEVNATLRSILLDGGAECWGSNLSGALEFYTGPLAKISRDRCQGEVLTRAGLALIARGLPLYYSSAAERFGGQNGFSELSS